MPFKSEKQRRYLWMHKPKMAKEWSHKYGSKPRPSLQSAAKKRLTGGQKSTGPKR